MTRISRLTKALALGAYAAGALLGVCSAKASVYSAEYVFGDSLSDRGNVAELLNVENYVAHGYYFGNFPNPPSYHDSFTNGPVAVQGLAQSFGLNADPSLWVTGFADPPACSAAHHLCPERITPWPARPRRCRRLADRRASTCQSRSAPTARSNTAWPIRPRSMSS